MSDFDHLPNEQIIKIALDLSLNDINKFCTSSQRFRNLVCDNDQFWGQRYEQDFILFPPKFNTLEHLWKEEGMSWQKAYQLQLKRNKIYKFISKSMDRYDFERGLRNGNDVYGFTNREDFDDYQKGNLDEASEEDLLFYEMLMQRMDNIKLSDKESMVAFSMDGFCFDVNNKLVMTNAR